MHKGLPLLGVPTDYLRWCLSACNLSSGLRSAVAAELASRGVQVPEPPPRPEPLCREHPGAGCRCLWGEDSLGRKFIRAECVRCCRSLGIMPKAEPYIGMADASATPTPVLDALVGFEAAGVEVRSDGKRAWVDGDYRRVPPDVRNALRQAKHQLAKMVGDNRQEVRGDR
jgi:hypothetical protein